MRRLLVNARTKCVLMILLAVVLLIACVGNTAEMPSMDRQKLHISPSGQVERQQLRVFVEPEAGEQIITQALAGARVSVWLEMYLLSDKKVIRALEQAAQRQVEVRVMLEPHPYGAGAQATQETLDKLQAAGVLTRTTSPQFALTHEKGMVIDGQTTYIMTTNFTSSALGTSKYTHNREYGIIDTWPQDVQTFQDIFIADWNRQPITLTNPRLVVSPLNARTHLLTLILQAKTSLLIEAEELQDIQLEQALIAAASRGVSVQIILPKSTNGNDANHAGVTMVERGGVQVKEDGRLYMHAKIIVADYRQAFVGSENISLTSLDKNRELGILITDATILQTLQQTFQQDWHDSQKI